MPDKPPTRSLRPATNAAARMQEVMKRQQESNTTSSAVGNATGSEYRSAESITVAPPDTSATISTDGSAPGSLRDSEAAQTVADADSGAAAQTAAQKGVSREEPSAQAASTPERQEATGRATSSAVALPTAQTDPLKTAMLGLLAQPYPKDMRKGQMTVTSVKIPTAIWERLDYVRSLTKKDKQDIIADALLLYYEHVQRTGGEDEEEA